MTIENNENDRKRGFIGMTIGGASLIVLAGQAIFQATISFFVGVLWQKFWDKQKDKEDDTL